MKPIPNIRIMQQKMDVGKSQIQIKRKRNNPAKDHRAFSLKTD
jgi:hypothetical protein